MNGSDTAKVRASTIVSFAALLLSFCGVIVSIFQTRIMIQQQRAMVWPHLQYWSSDVDGYVIAFNNAGLGPALVRDLDIQAGAVHYHNFGDFAEAMKTVMQKQGVQLKDLATIRSGIEQRTLRAGEEVQALRFRGPESATRGIEQVFGATDWDFRLVYSSIHGQCFELSRSQTKTLDRCPDPSDH